jgi:hypothetical protein
VSGPDESDIQPLFVGPHQGREFELMLEGKKHLSMFQVDDSIEHADKRFDSFVAEGRFVKDVRIERFILPDGTEVSWRNILYATANEAWRIPAMRLVQDVYRTMGPGWRPDLERVIGLLLGYDSNDIERFVERLADSHSLN